MHICCSCLLQRTVIRHTHPALTVLQRNWILSILWLSEQTHQKQTQRCHCEALESVSSWCGCFYPCHVFTSAMMNTCSTRGLEHLQGSMLHTHASQLIRHSLKDREGRCRHTVCTCFFHIRFVCFPLSNVHHSWGRLWDNAASKITFQCPISCLSVRMKLPYKHHCASWPSALRSFVSDWAAKSILAFLCQQLCPCMMMSLLPVSACEEEGDIFIVTTRCEVVYYCTSWPLICSSIKCIKRCFKMSSIPAVTDVLWPFWVSMFFP